MVKLWLAPAASGADNDQIEWPALAHKDVASLDRSGTAASRIRAAIAVIARAISGYGCFRLVADEPTFRPAAFVLTS